jgi:hypothetical protein
MAASGDGSVDRCGFNRHSGNWVDDVLLEDNNCTYFIIMMVISIKTVRH